MVTELAAQQKEEVEKRDWCTAELNSNKRATAAGYDKKESDLSLRPDDGRVRVRVSLGKLTFCYTTGHHKQYILPVVDIIFNYIFHFGLHEHVFI